MRISSLLLFLSAAAVLSTACIYQREAVACTPAYPVVVDSKPSDGQVYPLDAAVFISGWTLEEGFFKATINDEPVSLTRVEELTTYSFLGEETLALRTSPLPEAGDVVHIDNLSCQETAQCEPFEVQWTAGAPMGELSPGVVDFAFDAATYDETEYYSGPCEDSGMLETAWFVDFLNVADTSDQPPVTYRIDILTADELEIIESKLHYSTGASFQQPTPLVEYAYQEIVGPSYDGNSCVRITTINAAGYSQQSEPICKPCQLLHIERGDEDFDSYVSGWPAEPNWDNGLPYCGGPCDDSDSCTLTGDDESEGDFGCGGETSSNQLLALFLPYFLIRRRS